MVVLAKGEKGNGVVAVDVDLGTPDFVELREIGSGGFATVYLAFDAAFHRRVAIKVINLSEADSAKDFRREAKMMGQLSGHAHVITPYRSGTTTDGRPYLVMEYVDGGSLDDLIQRRGPIPWPEAIDLILPIADALEFAHRKSVLHRDVKPANILVADDTTKLTDFGISYGASEAITQATITPAHAPPELFAGGLNRTDHRSDLYSLASTLFTLVAGRAPFGPADPATDSMAAYYQRIQHNAVPLISGADGLNSFLQRAMAKDPNHRPADASVFTQQLTAVRSGATTIHADPGQTIHAPSEPVPEPQTQPRPQPTDAIGQPSTTSSRSVSTIAGWAFATVALLAVLGAGWYGFLRPDSSARPDAADPDTSGSIDDPAGSEEIVLGAESEPNEETETSTDTTLGPDALSPQTQQARTILGDPTSLVAQFLKSNVLPTTNIDQSAFTSQQCGNKLEVLQLAFGTDQFADLRAEINSFPSGAPINYTDPAGQNRGYAERLEASARQMLRGYSRCFNEGDIAHVGIYVFASYGSTLSFLCTTHTTDRVKFGVADPIDCPVDDEIGLCNQIVEGLSEQFFAGFPDKKPNSAQACQAAVHDDEDQFANL